MNRLIIATTFLVSLAASAAPPVDDVTVRVRVWTQDGEPARDAYVALVPIWRPWSDPLVEAIAVSGTHTFRVPKGTYYFVAGARGSDVSSEGPFRFLATSGNASAELKPLKRVTGLVSDESGKGLAGVRVSQSRAVMAPPLGTFSKLAIGHLSADWSTLTGVDGRWILGMPNSTVPMLFVDERYAPQWRFYRPGESSSLKVAMSAGSALHVSCDRDDPELALSLEREGADLVGSVPRDWQRQIWAQSMTGKTLEWSSLPAGAYSVYARYLDTSFFMGRAVKVGSVNLTAGETSAVKVTLPPPRQRARSTAQFFIEGVPSSDLKDVIDAFALDRDVGVRHVSWLVQQAVGGSVLFLDGDLAGAPYYAITPDRFIAADFDAAARQTEPSRVHQPAGIYPRADGYATLRSAEKDMELPRTGLAVFRDCEKTKSVMVPVEIDKGLARFTVAAGCRNGVLSFVPFEPILVSASLRPGDQSLGDYLLHVAASADVKVVREPEPTVVPGATVRVMAWDASSRYGQWIATAEAETGADGWAHLSGVPVFHDLQVFARTAAGEISVADDRRADPRGKLVIDPLVIPKPAALVIVPTIKDSVRAVFPSARVLHISIDPVDPRRAEAEEQQHEMAAGETSVRFDSMKPGKWLLSAIVRVAGTEALLKADEIELKSGETRKVEAEFEPLVFNGRVTMGGKGVAAHVTLENLSSPERVRQHFLSLSDGSYSAVLSARGSYNAVVGLKESQSETMPAGDVRFDDPARPVNIAVPEASAVRVHVRMKDQPVPRIAVRVSHLGEVGGLVDHLDYGRLTDSTGDAKFDHITPGDWAFSVRDEEAGWGAEKSLSVEPSQTAEVTLEVEKVGGIKGMVHDESGISVANAQVDCVVLDANGVTLRLNGRTDFDGGFSLGGISRFSLPALCSVTTPAGVVDAFKAADGDSADIELPAATATLQITDWGKWYRPDTFWLTAGDGRTISLSAVAQAFTRFGPSLQIRALAAGHWSVVRIASIAQWNALAAGQVSALPAVADATVEAGAARTIQIYETPALQGGLK